MSAAARPELVLLPGLLCDAELWRDQIAALGDEADVWCADLTQGETLEALAQGVLDRAGPRFALAAFSLGGYVAQVIARRAPERVERLALLDTSAKPDSPARAAERVALSRAAEAPGAFRGITDRLLARFVHPARLADAALSDRIGAMTRRLGREVFLRQNAMARPDGTAALAALDGPLLILCGADDAITPAADHRALAAELPRAHLVVVPDCGHMAPMEAPDAVTRALRAWLRAPAGDGLTRRPQ